MDQVAMVQIVENHAEIAGELTGVAPAPERPGFVSLTVRIDHAAAVGDSRNLFEYDIGRTVEVLARDGSPAAALKPGPVRLRVKKNGPATIFAE